MGRIEFGWSVPMGARDKARRATFVDDVQRGLDLIAGRFGSAWLTDHLQFEGADRLEGWTELVYLSALNPRLSFGHAVLCQSFRNPALLAKMAATLQFMSQGRFILGIGAGWHEEEYRAYGYDFPPAGARVEQLDEYLQITKALWTEERATVQGKHYRVVEAWCEPKPDPLPVVMIGGSKPRMLRLIARHADWWNVSWTPIEEYRPQVEECERACAEVGRDPATLRRTWFGGCACGRTEQEVEELSEGRLKAGSSFVGTPAQIVEQMRPFVDLGVDYFMLNCGGFPRLTTLELLVNEVLPALE
jgi:alkanesulfonate monooxygenase SsuD/methylene tetrahydromethanopterin reductase-like flavin-dependent oxidoreductase (luciferase family)